MPPQAVAEALRQATCLLPPHARACVQAELLADLWQTRLDAELRGLDEAAAWDAALATLGPRWPLAFKLARVHTLAPVRRLLLGRWLLVGVALGGAAYAVQTQVPTVQEARP